MGHVEQELSHIVNGEPSQRSELAKIAVGEIASGIKKLAQLGHNYRLVRVPQGEPAGPEWPKMLYKDSGQIVVESEEDEEKARKDGWDDPPGVKAAAEAKAKAEAKAEKKPEGKPPASGTGGGANAGASVVKQQGGAASQ